MSPHPSLPVFEWVIEKPELMPGLTVVVLRCISDPEIKLASQPAHAED